MVTGGALIRLAPDTAVVRSLIAIDVVLFFTSAALANAVVYFNRPRFLVPPVWRNETPRRPSNVSSNAD
jgi:hypothetical protein